MASYEAISVFDMFKIGVGPSSSHTLGPWKAALEFVQKLDDEGKLSFVKNVRVLLYGSLAKTGVGHGTDVAVQLGLSGEDPVTFDVNSIDSKIADIKNMKQLVLNRKKEIDFEPTDDIEFLVTDALPYHPNALTFLADLITGENIAETYYSIGGGFIVQETNFNAKVTGSSEKETELTFPINTGEDLLHWSRKTGMSISDIVLENEKEWRSSADTNKGLLHIYDVMKSCIYNGCNKQGFLPGGLQVKRRAYDLNKKLLNNQTYHSYDEWVDLIKKSDKNFNTIVDWVSCFALAVNEENASFGRVVTAPTNGAAGVIPAVLQFYVLFETNVTNETIVRFLATASEIGSIFKKGATISAAMGGCQAEIGVSSAMASAALTEVLGGTQQQCIMAAEIAMEHHLGLTCDPIKGLVQIPCIERNSMGAIKAITASRLALQSSADYAKVSLDSVVKTMWDTAQDMNHKYKETADGGLAVNVPLSLSEC